MLKNELDTTIQSQHFETVIFQFPDFKFDIHVCVTPKSLMIKLSSSNMMSLFVLDFQDGNPYNVIPEVSN